MEQKPSTAISSLSIVLMRSMLFRSLAMTIATRFRSEPSRFSSAGGGRRIAGRGSKSTWIARAPSRPYFYACRCTNLLQGAHLDEQVCDLGRKLVQMVVRRVHQAYQAVLEGRAEVQL